MPGLYIFDFTELEFHALIRQLTPKSKAVLKPKISDTEKQYKIILEKESIHSKGYISRHKYDLNEYSYMDNRLIINNFNKVILYYKTIETGK